MVLNFFRRTDGWIVQGARERYSAKLEQANLILDRLMVRSHRMVWIRTALFLAAVFFLAAALYGATPGWLVWGLSVGFFLAFIAALSVHQGIIEQQNTSKLAQATYQHLLDRLDRNWDTLPAMPKLGELETFSVNPVGEDPAVNVPANRDPVAKDSNDPANNKWSTSDRQLANDLDLFGDASLFRLVSLAKTPYGRGTLARWMLSVADAETMRKRQVAVKTLAPCCEERENYLQSAAVLESSHDDTGRFLQWATGAAYLTNLPALYAASWLGGGAILLATLGIIVGRVYEQESLLRIAAGLFLGGIGWNLVMTIIWGGKIHGIFHAVTGSYHNTRQYQSIFNQLSNLREDGGLLSSLRFSASSHDQAAIEAFIKLNRLVGLAEFQRDPKKFLFYIFLQLFGLWDFHVLKRLETWQQTYSSRVHHWFSIIGTYEAILSCSALAFEYPQWTFASSSPSDQVMLRAKELGHPLLPDGKRVPNDLTIERDAPLLLITGSNMAGKSTMLRAMGLNLTLARLGAPVCAREFESKAFLLASSIRVQDSLRSGVSYFMAELHQLKTVVNLVKNHKDQPVFFLLDEILQGTNSRERQIAVSHVLKSLLEYGASGAITTHDLELAQVKEIAAVSQVVHFREHFEMVDNREEMRFDYRMYPGPTPTTNALKLLEIVGLAE